MGEVVNIEDYRPKSWLSGPMLCTGCRHEWIGACPMGMKDELECPECGSAKGVLKHAVVPEVYWICPCGGELFYFTPEGVYCRECGLEAEIEE